MHAGTDETVSLLLAARAQTHTEPPNVTGKEKERDSTGTRTQGLAYRESTLTAELPSHMVSPLHHNETQTHNEARNCFFMVVLGRKCACIS